MKYTEVTLKIQTLNPYRDILVYELGEGDYDSFVETPEGVKAYIPTHLFDESFLKSVLEDIDCEISYVAEEMPDKNWNEEWEKQHKSVLVEGEKSVYVRAPFHPHIEADYEIIIEPKMSFGTAHHATTYMMLDYLTEIDLQGKNVLDMGCGTAVLAILAKIRGAKNVDAVDIDEWAYQNALENADCNGVDLHCSLGDATTLPHQPVYDLVIANINRNILMHDMEHYVQSMKQGATILFSGFYESDIPVLVEHANGLGLQLQKTKTRLDWAALKFQLI